MAYAPQQLRVMEDDIVGSSTRFTYITDVAVDTIAACLASGFFSDGFTRGMVLGDEVTIVGVDDLEEPTVLSGVYKGVVSVQGTKAAPDTTVAGLLAQWNSMTLTATTAVGTTTISQVATSGKWAFASSTAAQAFVTRVTQMQANLETLVTRLETGGILTVTGN